MKRFVIIALVKVVFYSIFNKHKQDEDTADTVGCCSLRVEHISLKEPLSVTLDFLGKDSMRYLNTVEV